MAYNTFADIKTAKGQTYNGTSTTLVVEFSGIPGLAGTIRWMMDHGEWVATPAVKSRLTRDMLGYKIEQDTGPLFDKYRLTVYTAGAPDRTGSGGLDDAKSLIAQTPAVSGIGHIGAFPVVAVLVIVLAVGILALFGALAWKISRTSWSELAEGTGKGLATVLGPLLLIGGVLFIAYQALAKKGVVPRRNPAKKSNGGALIGVAAIGAGLLLMAGKDEAGKDEDGGDDGGDEGDGGDGDGIPPPPVKPAISKFNVRWN